MPGADGDHPVLLDGCGGGRGDRCACDLPSVLLATLPAARVVPGAVCEPSVVLGALTIARACAVFPLEGRYGLERMSQPGFNYKSCNNGFQVRARTLTPAADTTGNL